MIQTAMRSATAGAGASGGMGSARRRLLRVMYGVNVVGAGIPGLVTVVAPGWAADALFGAAAPPDPMSLRMLGAVWLAVGALSLQGLRHPLRFSAIFPVEAVYKAVWLATAAPALLRGDGPQVVPMALLFALWVAADVAVTPYGYLLGGTEPRA